jgi:hypothetical protein
MQGLNIDDKIKITYTVELVYNEHSAFLKLLMDKLGIFKFFELGNPVAVQKKTLGEKMFELIRGVGRNGS